MLRTVKNLMLGALLLTQAQDSVACMWIKGTTLEGALRTVGPAGSSESRWMLIQKGSGKQSGYADALRLLQAMTPTQFFEWIDMRGGNFPENWPTGLDEAVKPLFHGNSATAIEFLNRLNQTIPDNYFIHANLGVALELAGRDREALEHVEKARAINPGAHRGTEWMHAAVLRAKIALAENPSWLDTHSISGVPMGPIPPDFQLVDGPVTLNLKQIHNAMFAHALPRVLFTKPKNPVTAALLHELARVEARGLIVEGGLAVLAVAEDYGAKDTAGLRQEWRQALVKRRWRKILLALTIIISVAAGLLAIIWAVRIRHKNRSATGTSPI